MDGLVPLLIVLALAFLVDRMHRQPKPATVSISISADSSQLDQGLARAQRGIAEFGSVSGQIEWAEGGEDAYRRLWNADRIRVKNGFVDVRGAK